MSLKLEKKVEFGNLNIYGVWTDKRLYPYEMAVVFDGNTLFMRQGKYEIKYELWSVEATRDKNEILPALKDDMEELNDVFLKCKIRYNSVLKKRPQILKLKNVFFVSTRIKNLVVIIESKTFQLSISKGCLNTQNKKSQKKN